MFIIRKIEDAAVHVMKTNKYYDKVNKREVDESELTLIETKEREDGTIEAIPVLAKNNTHVAIWEKE